MMRWLGDEFRKHLCRRIGPGSFAGSWRERFSKYYRSADELSLEEDAERKVGMLLKMIFVATAGVVAYQFFPYMGDNLLHQSVSLLQVKDPMFKRMGASRLSRFAIDDERRMKIVEIGGAKYLLNMLESAKDDRTRKEALKALVALSHSEQVAGVLHQSGVLPIIISTPNSLEYIDIENYKSKLMKRYEDLKYDTSI
ncbi:ARM repeat superfamily protein [Zostera marina]|uniref:ARM repeat superfamily protein n=1 Tax=Zostera marina TaxID=29655 RepID=A0A0K9PZ52_ZOSMR|nr:ARM repeat superfamily protein [Zostera marina]